MKITVNQQNYHDFSIFEVNKLPGRSYFIPYPDREGADRVSGKEKRYRSSKVQCLNGTWDFKFYPVPGEMPDVLDTDAISFDSLDVPSCWQFRGYDHPFYVNIRYQFPFRPPIIPTTEKAGTVFSWLGVDQKVMPRWKRPENQYNFVGVYRRFLDIAETGKRFILSFLGVSSCLDVYVNGQFIGYSEGSHNTAEFDYSFMKEVGGDPLKFYKMEGYLFPDKYEFYKNDKPENVAKKFFDNFQKKVSPYFDQMKEKGMTLEETITLASIIQSEAATEAQMPGISSVFHNRLNNPQAYPHLETDPTIKYVEEVIKPNIGTANQAMYDAYNTKVCIGLPVGPISNPGIKAIEAALNPESTNYYFFVHNVETGECLYASTYAQHQANCRKLGIIGA